MAGSKRKPLPKTVQNNVLVSSRRRCALCFHLNDDLKVKKGQLAHIDRDAANHVESNLVFLCLDHHSEYDSTTSQHKNLTPRELIVAKHQLEQAIAEGRHRHTSIDAQPIRSGRDTDRKSLDDLIALMTSTKTMRFLRDANFGGWSFAWLEVEGLDSLSDFKGAEHEFIDPDLEALRKDLLAASETFLTSLARNTRPTAHTPGYRAVPQDEEGFDETVRALRVAADKVCAIYDELVRIGRKRLAS